MIRYSRWDPTTERARLEEAGFTIVAASPTNWKVLYRLVDYEFLFEIEWLKTNRTFPLMKVHLSFAHPNVRSNGEIVSRFRHEYHGLTFTLQTMS